MCTCLDTFRDREYEVPAGLNRLVCETINNHAYQEAYVSVIKEEL